MSGANSFGTRGWIELAGVRYAFHRLAGLPGVEGAPLSTKILLENLLRHEDGTAGGATAEEIASLLAPGGARGEIGVRPSRIFLHDTNGVPVLTTLAALRDAVARAGGDPASVRPVVPAELTVDHSIATDVSARPDARERNTELEFARNEERYRFLRWGSRLDGLTVIPPGSGIMHQINIERLARVVERRDGWAYPDLCLGTDSHTTMVNGLGVLGWGIGGVEAEAALLGLPVSLQAPRVVGVELTGRLGPGVTATDLVLTLTERLRAHGVVGAVVEFFGPGLAAISVETRTTIANMAPEYGATSGLFPVDAATLAYLRLTGRSPDQVAAVETYCKEQLLWPDPGVATRYDQRLAVDMSRVEPSLAGPRRPQDRIGLPGVRAGLRAALGGAPRKRAAAEPSDGAVAIAAITSCANTSNPEVMIAAGLLARNACRRGLTTRPWVKTSLAPGSTAVTRYLTDAGLDRYLDQLGFQTVGYGCMTCIGNSGDLLPAAARAVRDGVRVASVLSGNRNFDGRVNNDVGLNYLASPPLVVAYALAGTVDRDLTREPLGTGGDGRPVYLSEIWPDDAEIRAVVASSLRPEVFTESQRDLPAGEAGWSALDGGDGLLFDWRPESTYIRRPPFLDGVGRAVPPREDILGARVLTHLGDSVTTDHISPAGRIPASSPAGRYLAARGVAPRDLNTYASRRGNFEVMRRGGFSHPRLRNRLVQGGRGGVTRDADGAIVPVFDAAESFARARIPLVVVGGEEYGTGSSRDWAAKATALLGVRAVLARSFERIHRSNLVHMGVLPLEFVDGRHAGGAAPESLDGADEIDVLGLRDGLTPRSPVRVRARSGSRTTEFTMLARVDTGGEAAYFRQGGILPLVLRQRLER
ncbi:aconitate hydratase AcnA [Streptomyces sp. SBT349]|uniref:aconitate hydratase AcnA n=1 Tax=Streptomyces sp. SBT349 TaxID=1580539 RepID=UPI00066B3E15|nr:aconitate hydratase AcnA [Streptomyces sp. SBT349]